MRPQHTLNESAYRDHEDLSIYYEPRSMLFRATVCVDDVVSQVCSDCISGLDKAIGEAIELIAAGKITPQEPVFYNPDEADIDKQLAAMRPKEPARQSMRIPSSSSINTSNGMFPFVAACFLAGVI